MESKEMSDKLNTLKDSVCSADSRIKVLFNLGALSKEFKLNSNEIKSSLIRDQSRIISELINKIESGRELLSQKCQKNQQIANEDAELYSDEDDSTKVLLGKYAQLKAEIEYLNKFTTNLSTAHTRDEFSEIKKDIVEIRNSSMALKDDCKNLSKQIEFWKKQALVLKDMEENYKEKTLELKQHSGVPSVLEEECRVYQSQLYQFSDADLKLQKQLGKYICEKWPADGEQGHEGFLRLLEDLMNKMFVNPQNPWQNRVEKRYCEEHVSFLVSSQIAEIDSQRPDFIRLAYNYAPIDHEGEC